MRAVVDPRGSIVRVRMFRYAAAVAVAAAGGGTATRRSVSTWYPGLRKPSWTPPSQVFAPVWTVLYAQMAYSANRVARSSDPGRRRALALWWLQLGLNAAWTPVFFGARRTGAAAGGRRRSRARRRSYRGHERARRPTGRAALRPVPCLVDLCGRAQPRDLAAEPLLDDRLAIGLCRPQCVDADAGGVGRAVPRPSTRPRPGAGEAAQPGRTRGTRSSETVGSDEFRSLEIAAWPSGRCSAAPIVWGIRKLEIRSLARSGGDPLLTMAVPRSYDRLPCQRALQCPSFTATAVQAARAPTMVGCDAHAVTRHWTASLRVSRASG